MAGAVMRTSAVRLARPAAAIRRKAVMKLLYYFKRGGRDCAFGESGHSVCADGRRCNPQRNKKPLLEGAGADERLGLAVYASRPGMFRGPLTDLDSRFTAARRTVHGITAHSSLCL